MSVANNELIEMTATEAVTRLRSQEISPIELVDASIQRIETVDTEVNALPIQCFEQAREQAKALDLKVHAENPKSLCGCLLYTSPSPRDLSTSRMPSSA